MGYEPYHHDETSPMMPSHHFINLTHFLRSFIRENKVYASCKFVEHVEQFGWTIWTRTSKNSGILDLESLSMGDHFIKFDLPKLISNLNPFTMVKPDTGER
jgi:hypothetical protein